MIRSRILTLLTLTGGLGACGSDRPAADAPSAGASPTPLTVTVTATDYALDLPDRIPAGPVTLHLVNHGKELHQAQIVRFEEGKTAADLAAAMKQHGPPPSWLKFVGGPNGVEPGDEASASGELTPGNHAVLCFIPSPDGVMHLAKGMMRPFEVTAAEPGGRAELPAPSDTIRLVDYDFKSAAPLMPGRKTILVANDGPQPHELVLLKLAPGKTVEDFAHWAEGGLKGPPPAKVIGGVAFLDQGAEGQFEVELTQGDYGFICFVPDSKDGKPHLAHGMMKQITVGA